MLSRTHFMVCSMLFKNLFKIKKNVKLISIFYMLMFLESIFSELSKLVLRKRWLLEEEEEEVNGPIIVLSVFIGPGPRTKITSPSETPSGDFITDGRKNVREFYWIHLFLFVEKIRIINIAGKAGPKLHVWIGPGRYEQDRSLLHGGFIPGQKYLLELSYWINRRFPERGIEISGTAVISKSIPTAWRLLKHR